MAEIRTFVAIHVPTVIIDRLVALQQQWRQAGADVSWTRPEGVHITLKFLGNVPEERLAAIGDALAAVAARHTPFSVAIEGTGGFPTTQRPRVIWAGIGEGEDPLRTLAAEVDAALTTLGFPRDTRPFRPHLTLGRVRSSRQLSPLTAMVAAHVRERFGEMPVTEMLLMRSELSPQGARYTTLRRAALAGTSP